ncbi:MAG: nuclear transport factor 2 family protein [Gemmatimonadaceae bacterium]|nr:nuclear transport factor 2 family protein [Gemmatimonadaceae bacterium]
MTTPADAIRTRRDASNAAIASRDAGAVVSCMTDDVTVAVAGGAVLVGRDASRRAFAEQMAEPGFRGYVRTPEEVDVTPDGRTATETGRWVGTWQVRLRLEHQRGTYVARWRCVDGTWFLASEIFSG